MRPIKSLATDCIRIGLFFAVAVFLVQSAYSDDDRFSAYVSAGTADIHRGLLRHDKPVALQAAARFEVTEALSLGVAVHDTQFISRGGSVSDETEVDYSVAYSNQVGEEFAWQIKFIRYSFPGSSDAVFEYDFNELSIYFELPKNVGLAFSVSDTNFNFTKGLAYGELTWRRAIPFEFELSAAIGATKALSRSRRGYAYWDVGFSRFVGPLAVDLRYHYSPYNQIWFGREPARGDWALNLSYGW